MLIRAPAANGAGDYSPMKRESINETAGAVSVGGWRPARLILVNDKAIGGGENRVRDLGKKAMGAFHVVIRKLSEEETLMAIQANPLQYKQASTASRGIADEGPVRVPWLFAVVGTLAGASVFVIYRWYQQTYCFTVGMDSFEPEFQIYWMRLFYIQMSLITLAGAIGVPLLWFTRPADPMAMPARTELRVYYTILAFAAIASVLVVAVLGVYVEADAAWHQITIRDTDFTPTHIGLFYFAIPLALVGLVLGFVWIHTRVPYFVKRISIPLALMAAGPILIMPNLGLNEWGHTFFLC